jgi:hypothetical protein
MHSSDQTDFVLAERRRIQIEYERREREVNFDAYAAWQPTEHLMIEGRTRLAINMLNEARVLPTTTSQCLEIGFGSQGWLSKLINWGVRESNLHGIELDPKRADEARELLPLADLRVGDAVELPWSHDSFNLVITSTYLRPF